MAGFGVWRAALLVPLLLLAACGGDTILPPAPTKISMNVEASGDVNPNAEGRASPVVLRIYSLKSPAIFNEADIFQLFEAEAATLGPDLLGREEVVVMPGSSQLLDREVPDDTTYIGVIANFRDADHAIWRGSAPITPHHTTDINVGLRASAVSVTAE